MKKVFSIAFALSISLFIYVFYRSEKTLINELMAYLLSLETYHAMKSTVTQSVPLPNAVVFSLPGGLWIFCATALARGFYMNVKSHRLQVGLIPIVFAITLELCQAIDLTNGTFDMWDIFFYLFFWMVAFLPFERQKNQRNLIAPFTLHGFICVACFLSVYLAHVNQ